MLKEFKKNTNCPVLVNTSFNVRGEPIVCSVTDAYKCFIDLWAYITITNQNVEKAKNVKRTCNKRKARLANNYRRAKEKVRLALQTQIQQKEEIKTHDIKKTITLDDLTNPNQK